MKTTAFCPKCQVAHVVNGERAADPQHETMPLRVPLLLCNSCRTAPSDVIQLDPDSGSGRFGPLLCIVDECRPWGVKCYAIVAEAGDNSIIPLRVPHTDYHWVGHAIWVIGRPAHEADTDPPEPKPAPKPEPEEA